MAPRRRRGRTKPSAARPSGAYVLVARGPDGRAHCESFRDTTAYRSRLAMLRSSDGPVSLDELVNLLVESQPRD
jgi:hypothetical protein